MSIEHVNEPTGIANPADPVDLLIVGGGLAGLLAANLAVDAGLSVRLLEKQRSLGGRASSSEHHGYTLNQGPHALYVSGELNTALRTLGIDAKGSPPQLKGATASIGDTVGALPQGPATLLTTPLLPARGKRRLGMIMARLPRMDPGQLASLTVDRWVESLTDVSQVRTLLKGLVTLGTYNAASDIASADVALSQTQMALSDGVLYLHGGWSSIVDALTERLGEAGVAGRFRKSDAGAIGIDRSDSERGRLHLVHADGAAFSAANVLVAAGSPEMADRLIGGGSHLAEAAGPAVQAAVMDLGLNVEPALGVHLGLDTALYYSKHSVADGLAPAGASFVSLVRYLRPGEEHSAQDTKDQLMAHAAAAGITPDQITMTRYLHRLTVAWGMPLAENGGLAGRPTHAVPGLPGAYVAGDWVGDRGLLADASAASASDAVASIVADTGRRAAALADKPSRVG